MAQDAAAKRPERRLKAAKALLAHVGAHVPVSLPVRLWDGSIVWLNAPAPDAALKEDACGIAINSPMAITRLLWRPGFKTLARCLAAGELEVFGGTLFDLIKAAPQPVKTKALLKTLNKALLLKTALVFLFARERGNTKASDDQAYRGAIKAAHTRGRDDRALVEFHYDLSNDFYALFLDPQMQYSCAYFQAWDGALEDAQLAKLDIICRKLRLKPGEAFLDIGCGWGGLICHAARHYGVSAHGVTLSAEQYAFTREKIARFGLEDKVTVALQDFRALTGSFDKIASIGMFEHVGLDNHDAYFRHIHGLLRPRGLLLNHAITRPAKRTEAIFRAQNAQVKAISTYIFPGSALDYIGRSLTTLERNGFEVHDVEAWREHYARTTKLWCERLYARRVAAQGHVGEAKVRLWLLYLAGVSLAFERGTLNIFQTLASKKTKGSANLPPTRADWYA